MQDDQSIRNMITKVGKKLVPGMLGQFFFRQVHEKIFTGSELLDEFYPAGSLPGSDQERVKVSQCRGVDPSRVFIVPVMKKTEAGNFHQVRVMFAPVIGSESRDGRS